MIYHLFFPQGRFRKESFSGFNTYSIVLIYFFPIVIESKLVTYFQHSKRGYNKCNVSENKKYIFRIADEVFNLYADVKKPPYRLPD